MQFIEILYKDIGNLKFVCIFACIWDPIKYKGLQIKDLQAFESG